MIDAHTHLDLTPGEPEEVVERARAAGVTKLLSIGTEPQSCRTVLALADRFAGTVYAAVGRHPNSSSGFSDADAAELSALARDPRCRAIGETGLDFFRDGAPRADQERAFVAQIAIARDAGKPLVIHTRAADDASIDLLARDARDLTVILHCFSMPERVESASGTAGSSPTPATSPTRARRRSPPARCASRSTACLWRPTRHT